MDGFVERVAALEHEMTKLTDIAVALARYDERILAMTTRMNLMDKRWEDMRDGNGAAVIAPTGVRFFPQRWPR